MTVSCKSSAVTTATSSITAGTSTPREVIEEVYLAILSMPGVIVSEASGMPPKEKYLH